MKQIPDRKRLRREYLRKKGKAHTQEAMGILVVVLACIAWPICGLLALSFGIWGLIAHWVWDTSITDLFAVVLKCAGLSLFFWLICKQADRIAQRGHEAIARMSYVPPVTPDILPAEEVLVRAAEEPLVVQREVLLRAAQGIETPKEELLRLSDAGSQQEE